MNKTFCDICGSETDYYTEKLILKSRSGHGNQLDYDLCYDCAKKIYESIKSSKSKGERTT